MKKLSARTRSIVKGGLIFTALLLLIGVSALANQMVQVNGHFITTEDKGEFVRVLVDGTEYLVQKVGETFSIDPLYSLLFPSLEINESEESKNISLMTSEEQAALWAIVATREREQDTSKLAEIVGDKNISNESAQVFLTKREFYKDLEFKDLPTGQSIQKAIRSRNVETEIIGFKNDNLRYVVDLIICDINTRACIFRVNGIGTGRLREGQSFQIDEKHSLEIKKINFDTCGEKRFCDTVYESYDEVEVEIR